ncbi:efflux RND transporter periplasmic adaptor subunit [Advenella sp. RU8]|uniref:efflux RND transporter periplasmic adaptor subunit n=1 Tax=Advenella sp. RU8 TaxID=3399575 RepID=UPI003AAD2275
MTLRSLLLFLALLVGVSKVWAEDIPAGQQRPALTVSVQPLTVSEVARTLSATGNIRPWQDASVSVQTTGLRLKQVFADVGDIVQAGQLLAEFDDTIIRAEIDQTKAAITRAQASLDQATKNANRIRRIMGSGAVSQQEVEQVLATEAINQAELASAQAALVGQEQRLAYTRLLAPYDGVVSAKAAVLGAVYNPGQELFHLIVQNKLQWEASVSGRHLGALEPGKKVLLHINDETSVEGAVRQLAPALNEQTRQAIVYVDIFPNDQVKAGMFVKGDFQLGINKVIILPRQALVLRDGFYYVFVLEDQNRVALRKIEIGQSLPDGVEVVSGLGAGENIVVKGARFLEDGDTVRVAETSYETAGR